MNTHGFINRIIKLWYPAGYVHSVMDFIEKEKRAMNEIGAAIIDMFTIDSSDKQYIIDKEREEYKQKWIEFFDYGLDLLGVSH